MREWGWAADSVRRTAVIVDLAICIEQSPPIPHTPPLRVLPSADLFRAALCSLGCLGVIVGAVLRVVPAFDLRATENPARLDDILSTVTSRAASAEYYRFWWFPHTEGDACVEWRAEKVPPRAHRPPPPNWLVAPLLRAWQWLLSVGIGFHLLQLALRVSVAVPALVPAINALWGAWQFSRVSTTVGRSDALLNFDCLFRQRVSEWSLPLEELPAVSCCRGGMH